MSHVILVGAMPPPVHGMAAVNAAIHGQLMEGGAKLTVIDVSAHSLHRSLAMRLRRLPKVLLGLSRLLLSPYYRGDTLYMSVSGGLGQLYEIAFMALARLRGMRTYLHYHSFAYLDRGNVITRALINVSGPRTVHVTLSPGMAERLKALYPAARRVVSISNAVFYANAGAPREAGRPRLRTLGFLSNIAAEKGIFEFLDLVRACQSSDLPLQARIAGPFQDDQTERKVRSSLDELASTEYVGPRYGDDKEAFLDSIDVLVFPTRYVNEAEPLALHEALRRGIPVIAYGRGAVPEIVDAMSGLVVKPGEPFVPAALSQLETWSASPEAYQAASRAAAVSFRATLDRNLGNWRKLVTDILKPGRVPERGSRVSVVMLLFKCRKLASILATPNRAWLRALRHGVGAGTEHVPVLLPLACNTVIDVGANRGQFALAARRCFPHARLVSFEPLPAPAAVYRRIFAGDPAAVLHLTAIGPERGKSLIHISEKDDSSSLLPPTPLQRRLYPGTDEVDSIPVEVGPLDSFLSKGDLAAPVLLKLDVQGYELKALQGCQSLFGQVDYIYVECSFMELYENQPLAHDIIRYLDDLGFELSGIYNVHYDRRGAGIQADFLFTRADARTN